MCVCVLRCLWMCVRATCLICKYIIREKCIGIEIDLEWVCMLYVYSSWLYSGSFNMWLVVVVVVVVWYRRRNYGMSVVLEKKMNVARSLRTICCWWDTVFVGRCWILDDHRLRLEVWSCRASEWHDIRLAYILHNYIYSTCSVVCVWPC